MPGNKVKIKSLQFYIFSRKNPSDLADDAQTVGLAPGGQKKYSAKT